jgi:ribosomal protein S20
MLPPSWKSEVQKAIEESADAAREQRQAEQDDASTKISAAIKTLSDAQITQTSHENKAMRKIARLLSSVYFWYLLLPS